MRGTVAFPETNFVQKNVGIQEFKHGRCVFKECFGIPARWVPAGCLLVYKHH